MRSSHLFLRNIWFLENTKLLSKLMNCFFRKGSTSKQNKEDEQHTSALRTCLPMEWRTGPTKTKVFFPEGYALNRSFWFEEILFCENRCVFSGGFLPQMKLCVFMNKFGCDHIKIILWTRCLRRIRCGLLDTVNCMESLAGDPKKHIHSSRYSLVWCFLIASVTCQFFLIQIYLRVIKKLRYLNNSMAISVRFNHGHYFWIWRKLFYLRKIIN